MGNSEGKESSTALLREEAMLLKNENVESALEKFSEAAGHTRTSDNIRRKAPLRKPDNWKIIEDRVILAGTLEHYDLNKVRLAKEEVLLVEKGHVNCRR